MSELIKQTWLFPVIQAVHLIGITMLVGSISLLDFRILGIGMRRLDIADLASGLAPWTWAGLLTVLFTGPLLFWSDLARYVKNPAFVLKMGLLAAALVVHFTIHRSAVPARKKLAAAFSLILWSSVVIAGRAIADFDIRPV